MNNWKIYIATLMVLAGCSDKGNQPDNRAAQYSLHLEPANLAILTRVGDETVALPQGTEIGLYAIDRETGSFNTGERRRNVAYQVTDGEGNISSFRPAIIEDTHSYDIYAYAPIRTVGLNEQTDNAMLTVRHGEDFLYASPVSLAGVSKDNYTAALYFTHRMAQVQFTLVADPDLSDEYMKGATFKVSGFYESALLSLNNGALSINPENGATIYNQPDLLQTVQTCVIPDFNIQKLTITLTTDKKGEQTKIYNFRFEAGKSYQFTIRYDIALDLEIETSVITWEEKDGGNINIGE